MSACPREPEAPKNAPPGADTACLDPIPGLDAEGLAGRGLHRGFGPHPSGSPPLQGAISMERAKKKWQGRLRGVEFGGYAPPDDRSPA